MNEEVSELTETITLQNEVPSDIDIDILNKLSDINNSLGLIHVNILFFIKLIGILISFYIAYILYKNLLKPYLRILWNSFKI